MGLFARKRVEDRALAPAAVTPTYAPYVHTGLPREVTTANALRVADAYACVRVLADAVASLPLHVYRRTPTGRQPAGDQARAVQLLTRPSPGSTSADLASLIMVHLNVYGECFVGKFRSDGEIVQLAPLHPDRLTVELRGQRIAYTLDATSEHGPEDILHIKGLSGDGLRGLSPVTQCRMALQLSSNLQENAANYFVNGSRPSGVLTVPTGSQDAVNQLSTQWNGRHGGVENMHRTAVLSGDVTFTPIAFSASDSQFLEQRELSAREVARIFRVPAWAIDAPTGDSMTYANVVEQNRAFVTHSLRPWLVRIERAISNDPDLCPGGTYVQFDLDGLLRADAKTRADIYTLALNPDTGWMTRAEVRDLEDLTPEGDTA